MWRCALPTVVWGNSDERGARRPFDAVPAEPKDTPPSLGPA